MKVSGGMSVGGNAYRPRRARVVSASWGVVFAAGGLISLGLRSWVPSRGGLGTEWIAWAVIVALGFVASRYFLGADDGIPRQSSKIRWILIIVGAFVGSTFVSVGLFSSEPGTSAAPGLAALMLTLYSSVRGIGTISAISAVMVVTAVVLVSVGTWGGPVTALAAGLSFGGAAILQKGSG